MSEGWPTDPAEVTTSEFARLVDVCDRYEAARRAGRSPQIEDLLGAASGAGRVVLFRKLLELELELRRATASCRHRRSTRGGFPTGRG